MSAYYNEIDPFAAQWIRNLIGAGLIAPGIVDERSIEDVQPGDLVGFTQCHFFAGIGVWSYALRQAGWPEAELLKTMHYYNHLRWYEHIPFDEFTRTDYTNNQEALPL